MHTLLLLIVPALLRATEEGPEPADVKAGWVAFGIFLLLVAAVVVLGFSLVKQLRKAQSAKDAGVYGDAPPTPDEPHPEDPAGPTR